MGFRFRTSFQLIPGLRLSVGTGGLSLRAGVPGLSVGISGRRTSLNVGLPGTGLSYSHTLLRHGQGGRAGYRDAAAERRAAAKQAALQDKAQALNAAVEELAGIVALTKVLERRARGPVDLAAVLAPSSRPVPAAFEPRAPDLSPAVFRRAAAARRPAWPWLLFGLLGGLPSVLLFEGTWVFVGVGIYVATAVFALVVQAQRAATLAAQLSATAKAEHAATEARRRSAHAAEQQAALDDHQRFEAMKRGLRRAREDGRPEAWASLLEVELANEDFPVPVVVDMEFDGLERVLLSLTLPELADVPADQPRVSDAGDLSRVLLSPAERGALFDRLCCSVALRLIYESFRVVPMLEVVELRGTFEAEDPAGRATERVCMQVVVGRREFEGLDLDGECPTAVVRALGRFGCGVNGELEGVLTEA